MITPTPTATSRRCSSAPLSDRADDAGAEGPSPMDVLGAAYWVEPGTRQTYPMAYRAYRRAREAEESHPARHRVLGSDVEHYLWRRWGGFASPDVDVFLTFRPEAPVRVRRIVVEILRAIRRGRPAGEAIRHVSKRFGLRRTRALEFMTASVLFETRPRQDAASPLAAIQGPPSSSLAYWV